MSVRKYGASATTWSLPVRVVLTVPAVVVPAWLIAAAVSAVDRTVPDGMMVALLLLIVGMALLALLPRFLRSVWAPNPRWQALQHATAVRSNAVPDELAKSEPAGPLPAPAITPTWGRRRW